MRSSLYRARKLLNCRIFEDGEQKRWAKSALDLNLEILCVSQFTLYHTLKGNKPDFRNALDYNNSKTLFDNLIQKLKSDYKPSLIQGTVNNFTRYVSAIVLLLFLFITYLFQRGPLEIIWWCTSRMTVQLLLFLNQPHHLLVIRLMNRPCDKYKV